MSKEIKEILDELESLFEISEAPEHIINGFNKLKDYITNLQQKVEQLEKEIDRLINLNKQLVEECQRLDDEETRLNNIINKLEQYLYEIDEDFEWDNGMRVRDMKEYLNKLKEENNVQ